MAFEEFKLTGQAAPIPFDGEGGQLIAPGIVGIAQVLSGHDLDHRGMLKNSLDWHAVDPLQGAIEENECTTERTLLLALEPAPRGTHEAAPLRRLRLRLKARDGWGSLLRVVHERGHVSWHLPLNRLWEGAPSSLAAGGTWEFEFPHVDAQGEGSLGLFGQTGRKIITEIGFRFFEAAGEELVRLTVGKAESRRVQERLRRIHPDRPSDPFEPFERISEDLVGKRVLVFVHGTISSTEGCFGDLMRAPSFREIGRSHSLILAYDHRTLSVGPDQNALDLGQKLLGLVLQGARIDILSHSRGGLVGRFLVEASPQFFEPGRPPGPQGPWSNHVENLVMVATPNAGTPLADRDHVVGLINAISLATHILPDPQMRAFLSIIISAVRLVASGGWRMPGIEAQSPGSAFLQTLNSGPNHSATRYSTAAAAYRPDGYVARLGSALWGTVNFQAGPHDLVVPADSPHRCRPDQAFQSQWTYRGGGIHHCSFFGHPETRAFIELALARG